ncbi:lamin tail domain-containing protein [Halorientalis salina]|uniref:lamin tail domain-containing protein n=1 Tax=Halorientalis salina TaxID=2932266 RepID=UPI0010AD571B|nr:lamin tail domain-containing protein [Halorientalis salina]
MDRGPAVALAVLVVASGCAGLLPVEDGGDGNTTAVLASSHSVTVTTVVDGDTIKVRFANGTTDTVRLLGVDTPETNAENSPGEFEGVPDTEAGRACLREAGHNATRYMTRTLLGETVQISTDAAADGRGYYGRLLAYVAHDGKNINYRLVDSGRARVYDSQFTQSDRFYAAEARAQDNRTGVWRCVDDPQLVADGGTTEDTPGSVVVARIHADAAGDDRENLNDEYVVLANRADSTVDLSGWTVSDDAGATYTVPEGTELSGDSRLTIRTGSGTDTDGERYWGYGRPVWNNDGDTVTVRAANGTVMAQRTYD